MTFRLDIEGNTIYIAKNVEGRYSRTFIEPKKSEKLITTGKSKTYGRMHTILTQIFKTSLLMFGDLDHVDVSLFPSMKTMGIMVKFGDVEISNSRGEKHLLKGTYMKMYINIYDNSVSISDMMIFRSDYAAFEVNYMHSHCRETSMDGHFGNICLGSSELGRKCRAYNSEKEIDWLEMFLYMDSYIRWESLEGGPYKRIVEYYEMWAGINIPSSDLQNIDMSRLFIGDGIPKLSYINGNLKFDNNSVMSKIRTFDDIKCNRSLNGYVYDARKFREYDDEKYDSTILSFVFFNGNYLNIKIHSGTEEYMKYIGTIFNNINMSNVSIITDQLNKKLKMFYFEPEYEIIEL